MTAFAGIAAVQKILASDFTNEVLRESAINLSSVWVLLSRHISWLAPFGQAGEFYILLSTHSRAEGLVFEKRAKN